MNDQPRGTRPDEYDHPFVGSLFERYSRELADMSLDPNQFEEPEGRIVGDTEAMPSLWDGKQSLPDSCAIRAQEYLIELYTGAEVDEYALVREARENGWYQPGSGTPPECVGNLLESHGIEIRRYVNSNIYHLADELGQGHKVIIGVDSDELWHRMPLFHELADSLGQSQADHAVIVSGIDTTDPGNPQVIVSDPGTGEAAARYPLDQFVAAWRDSGFVMVATTEPPPVERCPEMINFGQGGFADLPFRVAGVPFMEYLHGLWHEVYGEAQSPMGLLSDWLASGELSDISDNIGQPDGDPDGLPDFLELDSEDDFDFESE